MTSSAQLQREAEAARIGLALTGTLEKLLHRGQHDQGAAAIRALPSEITANARAGKRRPMAAAIQKSGSGASWPSPSPSPKNAPVSQFLTLPSPLVRIGSCAAACDLATDGGRLQHRR
jgi:hypothetical protein